MPGGGRGPLCRCASGSAGEPAGLLPGLPHAGGSVRGRPCRRPPASPSALRPYTDSKARCPCSPLRRPQAAAGAARGACSHESLGWARGASMAAPPKPPTTGHVRPGAPCATGRRKPAMRRHASGSRMQDTERCRGAVGVYRQGCTSALGHAQCIPARHAGALQRPLPALSEAAPAQAVQRQVVRLATCTRPQQPANTRSGRSVHRSTCPALPLHLLRELHQGDEMDADSHTCSQASMRTAADSAPALKRALERRQPPAQQRPPSRRRGSAKCSSDASKPRHAACSNRLHPAGLGAIWMSRAWSAD